MAHRTSQRRTLATDPDSKASSMDPTNLLLLKRQQPKPSASQRQTIPNPDTIKPSSISLFSMSTTKNLSKSLNSDHRIGSYQKPTSQILHNSKPKGEKKKFFQVLQEKEGEKFVSLKGSKEVEEGEEKKKEKFGVERNLVVSSPSSLLPLAGGGRNRRRSFCGSHVELADVFASNGVKVVLVDMPPLMQIHAVECARKTHDSMEKFTSKTLALTLKKEFDGVYGPAWHCIVGTSFGSFVTHSVGGFLYFSMDQKLYILLFKTTVQRAD